MKHADLRDRTRDYALAAGKVAQLLIPDPALRNAATQLIRCSASVAANYRAAGLARSRKEFISKLGLVIEEADEAVYWADYLLRMALEHGTQLAAVKDESEQLLRIFTASRNTARGHR